MLREDRRSSPRNTQRQIQPRQAHVATHIARGLRWRVIEQRQSLAYGHDGWHTDTTLAPPTVGPIQHNGALLGIPTVQVTAPIHPDTLSVLALCVESDVVREQEPRLD